jgi:hypothetical protein
MRGLRFRGQALATVGWSRRVLSSDSTAVATLFETYRMDCGVEHLVETARGVAGRLGVAGSISIPHVATTRGEVADLPGPITMLSGFDRDAPCCLVLIQGTFNAPPSPRRHPRDVPPEPRVLHSVVLTVDTKTGRIVGSRTISGDGWAPPDLAGLGELTLDASDTTGLDNWSPSWSAAQLEAFKSARHSRAG